MFHGAPGRRYHRIHNRKDAIEVLIELLDIDNLDLATIFTRTATELTSKKSQPTTYVSKGEVFDEKQINALRNLNEMRDVLGQSSVANKYIPLAGNKSNLALAKKTLDKVRTTVLEKYPDATDFLNDLFEHSQEITRTKLSDFQKNVIKLVVAELKNFKTPVEQYNLLIKKINESPILLTDTDSNNRFAEESIKIAIEGTKQELQDRIDPNKVDDFFLRCINRQDINFEDNETLAIKDILASKLPILQSIAMFNTLQRNALDYTERYATHDDTKKEFQHFKYKLFAYNPLENTAENEADATRTLNELTQKINDAYGDLGIDILSQLTNNNLAPPEKNDDEFGIQRRSVIELLSNYFFERNRPVNAIKDRPELYVRFLVNLVNLLDKDKIDRNEIIVLLNDFAKIILARKDKKSSLQAAMSASLSAEEDAYINEMLTYKANPSTENIFINLIRQLQNTRLLENTQGELVLHTVSPELQNDDLNEQEKSNQTANQLEVDSEFEDTEETRQRFQRGKPKVKHDETKEYDNQADEPPSEERATTPAPRKHSQGERIPSFDDDSASSSGPTRYDLIKQGIAETKAKKAERERQEQLRLAAFQQQPRSISPANGEKDQPDSSATSSSSQTNDQNYVKDLLNRRVRTEAGKLKHSLADDLISEEGDISAPGPIPSHGLTVDPELGEKLQISGETPIHNITTIISSSPPAANAEDVIEIQQAEESDISHPKAGQPIPSQSETLIKALYNYMYVYAWEFLPKPDTNKIDLLISLINDCRLTAKTYPRWYWTIKDPEKIMEVEYETLQRLKTRAVKERFVDHKNLDPLEATILKQAHAFTNWMGKNIVKNRIIQLKNADTHIPKHEIVPNEFLAWEFMQKVPDIYAKYSNAENKTEAEPLVKAELLNAFETFFKAIIRNNYPLLPQKESESKDDYTARLNAYEAKLQTNAKLFRQHTQDAIESSRVLQIRTAAEKILDEYEFIYAVAYAGNYNEKNNFNEYRNKILAIDTSNKYAAENESKAVELINDLMQKLGLDNQVIIKIDDKTDLANPTYPIKIEQTSGEKRRHGILNSAAVYLVVTVDDMLKRCYQQSVNSSEIIPLRSKVCVNMQEILKLDLTKPVDKERLPELIQAIQKNIILLSEKVNEIMKKYKLNIVSLQSPRQVSALQQHSLTKKRDQESVQAIINVPPKTPPKSHH